MELIICRDFYSNHQTTAPEDPDLHCKSLGVQANLADIRGWFRALAALPTLLVSILYGTLADKYGRRPILCFSMAGISLSLAYQMTIRISLMSSILGAYKLT
jgi:MFS family permease